MQYQTLCAGIALVSAASASPALNSFDTRQAPSGGCSTGVHVIAVGGANYTNPYDLGRLTPTAQSIVARIPGSSYVSVPYDKIDIRKNPKAVPGGIATLVKYVNDYHSACPAGKIALVGYSAGAVITMDGICDGHISPDLAGNTIIATIAYGDQTRVSGLPYDQGTCKTGHGKLAFKRNPAGCAAFANSIQSYCNINDPECCGGPPEDYKIHFVYPGEYDTVVSEYIASKFEQAVATGSSSSASATASSSASGNALVATSAVGSMAMVSPTPYPTTTPDAATPNNSTFTPISPASNSTALTAASPNVAFAVVPASSLIGLAFAAVLFAATVAL